MKKILQKVGKVFLPLALVAVGVMGMGGMVTTAPKPKTQKPEVLPPLVRTVRAETKTVRLVVHSQGTVIPRTEGTLITEVSGRVVEVAPHFAAGRFFQKGDVLLRIDPRDYELAVVRARAQVARARSLRNREQLAVVQARAQVAKASSALDLERAQADVAKSEWKSLGKGEATPLALRRPQLLRAQADLLAAQAQLDTALARVTAGQDEKGDLKGRSPVDVELEAARADLRAAEINLARTVIRGPYNGCIRTKGADVGQVLARGATLGRIFSVDDAEVRLPLASRQISHLPAGMEKMSPGQGPVVTLRAEARGIPQTWTGRIVRMEGHVDPKTRMVYVVARITDPYCRIPGREGATLPVGLFVKADIEGRQVDHAVVLPRIALHDKNRVHVINGKSCLDFRSVNVVCTDGDDVIVQGLAGDETLCLSGLTAATEGMKVRTEGQKKSGQNLTVEREVK